MDDKVDPQNEQVSKSHFLSLVAIFSANELGCSLYSFGV